jgi:hypothetical protein
MIDKGKYSSHGTFIKRLNKSAMVHWDKPKLGILRNYFSDYPSYSDEQAEIATE